MAAERVPLQSREQVVEHLLADLAAAPRGQLEPVAVARQVTGLLEPPSKVVEGIEIAHGLVAEQFAHLGAIDAGEVAGALDVGERVLQPLHRLEPPDLGKGAIERERFVTVEPNAIAEAAGEQQVEVRGQLLEVDEQAVVAQESLHHRFELRPLFGRHRAQERLHRGHPLGQLVDDVVEALGAREEPPVYGQELSDVGVAATDALPDQLVQVADHLAVRGKFLRRRGADGLAHPADELVQHLLAEPLDEVLEACSGLGFEEVVFTQVVDALAHVARKGVEPVQPLGGDVAEELLEVGVGRGRLGGAGFGVSGGGVRGGLVRVGCLRVGRVRGGRVRVTR